MRSDANAAPVPTVLDTDGLHALGLNRVAVIDRAQLPEALASNLTDALAAWPPTAQLILIGHAGRALWDAVQQAGMVGDNPIDTFTHQAVDAWFAERYPGTRYRTLYPGPLRTGLQQLGALVGWHQASRLMIGIDPEWGTWFAYRALVVAETAFPASVAQRFASPCTTCPERPCVDACPGNALAGEQFDLQRCVAYRKRPESRCKTTCVARLACPVGTAHRYDEAQLRHTYSISLRMIEALY